jgi:hypothetical protein
VTENQPARLLAAAASDWQDIYLRDKDGGTDVMFDGGVTGWPIHVTDNDLRLLLARLLERAGARYEVRGDGQFTRAAGPDGQPLTAQKHARFRSARMPGGVEPAALRWAVARGARRRPSRRGRRPGGRC